MNDYEELEELELERELLRLDEEEEAALAREDLLAFTIYTKPDYQIGWHHRILADKLNKFARGEIQNLMVFMPPRHGKSELVSRRFPAFLHGLYPDSEIMAASYLDSLAGEMCTAVQSIIDSPEYQKIFPNTKIQAPRTHYAEGLRNSSEHHIIGHKGKYRGQGVGGSFTGKGANFIIVDDPIKGREIADSEAFRERLWKFWKDDLYSRRETDLKTGRKGQVLITQTRWHEDDLSGRLLEQMRKDPTAIKFEILNYPAIRVDMDNASDPRQIGEALWPEKYNIKELNEMKATQGPRGWSSLYQQNPVPDGGALFKDDMFQFVDPPTQFDWSFITADTSYKEKEENDFTVFSAWGVIKDQLYLREVWRKQIRAADVEIPVSAFIKKFINYGYRYTWIEPKGHGIYLNQKFLYSGLRIPSESELKEFYNDRRLDKVERANNVIPHLANRKVFIGNNVTDKEYLLAESLSFPKAKHDDFVDTLVDALKATYNRKVSTLDVYGRG